MSRPPIPLSTTNRRRLVRIGIAVSILPAVFEAVIAVVIAGFVGGWWGYAFTAWKVTVVGWFVVEFLATFSHRWSPRSGRAAPANWRFASARWKTGRLAISLTATIITAAEVAVSWVVGADLDEPNSSGGFSWLVAYKVLFLLIFATVAVRAGQARSAGHRAPTPTPPPPSAKTP